MTAAMWSWLAALVSATGLWISGVSPRAGWIYGFGAQVIWILYGFFTSQPGMIALSVVFVALYMRNLYRWHGTQFVPKRRAENSPIAVTE